MALSRRSSTASLVTQSPKPGVAAIWGSIAGFFSRPNSTPLPDETQKTHAKNLSQSSEPPQVPDSYPIESLSSTYPQPSQVAGPSQAQTTSPPDHSANISQATSKPVFKARDFAYEPKPQIIDRPIDQAWVVPLKLPKFQPVSGMRERLGQQWENSHSHLFRLEGNRADPPNTIPKTWGGLSKAEDKKRMRQAKERIRNAERLKQAAAAFGLTPTEPNLGGPPPAPPLPEEEDRDAALRAEAYLKMQAAEAEAAGHGPLIPTPTNSPSPEPPRKGLAPPPSHSTRHRSLSPRTVSPARSKRKLETSDNEHEATGRRRGHKRQARQTNEEEETEGAGHSPPRRRGLRQRHADGTANTSPKGKGRSRASAP